MKLSSTAKLFPDKYIMQPVLILKPGSQYDTSSSFCFVLNMTRDGTVIGQTLDS